MRKILISEEQKRLIMESEMSPMAGASLPAFMSGTIESPENSLKHTGYFLDGTLTKMAMKRKEEIRSNFIDDITSYRKDEIFSKLNRLIAKCKRKEEPIRESLSKICASVVAEMFRIPEESVKLTCEIVEEIPPTESFHIKPDTDEDFEYDDIESIQANDAETKKRKIINAITCGAASRMAEQSRHMWVSDIFDLDEDLPHLYSQIMKINEYLVFNSDIDIKDNDHKQGGAVEVTLTHEDEMPEIHSRGIIFPILLHETIRGVIEILSSYGLPDNAIEARRIVDVSDTLEDDPWLMRLGPILWDKICNGIEKITTEDFPYFFKELVSLPVGEFERLMKNVFAGTKAGKEGMKRIYGDSKYSHEYDAFSQDLMAKRQEKDVIEDDYFTEEELEEGIYDYEG